ncbi:MAG: TldD/PmbA family protein, partial [Lachnospiraceae bacterium]|nr:TldD/PmbA family protein [Lachnospiraceae bacterium]
MILGENNEKSSYKIPDDEPVTFSKSTDYLIDPADMGDNNIIERLTVLYEKGMDYDDRILNFVASANYQKYSKLFLSKNRDMEQNIMWSTAMVRAMALRGEEVKDCYLPCSVLGGMEILNNLDDEVEKACKTAIELLESEPLPPGKYECICTPEVTGMIVHEAFGHGVEMDMFVKDRALAKNFIGE